MKDLPISMEFGPNVSIAFLDAQRREAPQETEEGLIDELLKRYARTTACNILHVQLWIESIFQKNQCM